ncbi:hypothetical protein ASG89_25095 [Paenibacillus sp. Soil766]|uniref:AraC family transcriptional regulator n=1 Tax=Paenibacillus sp. Soil766 TaxID=1736404 RepID=UPI00070DA243|nr:AraC family transcriptional regulator [Paenibacillus sp. Soil766]KRF02323.1 hypothetical protein ASG89_25095 [Paenibacillus sp. Soil766]
MDFSDIFFPRERKCMAADLSPSVHWAQRHITKRSKEYPERLIYDHELLYVQTGDIEVYVNGKVYHATTGSLVYFGAGVPHRIKVLKGNEANFLGIHFDYFDEHDVARDEDIIVVEPNPRLERFCAEPKIEELAVPSEIPVRIPPASIVAAMEMVIEEFTLRQTGYEAIVRGYMLQIVVELLRVPSGEAMETSHLVKLEELRQWIQQHYSSDCSNTALAARANWNEDYLAKLFKAAFGLTPNKYVQSVRLREAKRLLRESALSIEEIAGLMGYADLHYFSRLFSQREGIPPREYRRLASVY